MKDTLTVGEISSLFGLNVQTLHYYESIGIFCPDRKREGNGARLYKLDQIYRLASIRFLRRLGYPLERIKETLDLRTPEFSLEEMRRQSEEIGKRCEELARIKRAIERKVRFVQDKVASMDTSAIELRTFPVRCYLPLGFEENLYRQEDFYYYPTVVFYQGDEKIFGAMLTEDCPEEGISAHDIPAGDYLVGYHEGPYEVMGRTIERIRKVAAARGLGLEGGTVNINVIDQFVERNPDKYVTEVEMRVHRGE